MKVRSELELQELISQDFAWRKKELSAIKSNIATSRAFAKETALRSGITLLYAHWEGFIKNTATYYLAFVAQKKLKYQDLTVNFLAIAMKQKLTVFEETKKTSIHIETVKFLLENQYQSSEIPYDNIVKTNSNLNSNIFKEIMATLGLSCSKYELNFNLIDEQLLAMRNAIAHGENLKEIDLDESKFNMIYEKVLDMLNTFESQVMNAACLKEYLKVQTIAV